MDPENHWLVEENQLPGGQPVRVHVSFRKCIHSTPKNIFTSLGRYLFWAELVAKKAPGGSNESEDVGSRAERSVCAATGNFEDSEVDMAIPDTTSLGLPCRTAAPERPPVHHPWPYIRQSYGSLMECVAMELETKTGTPEDT